MLPHSFPFQFSVFVLPTFFVLYRRCFLAFVIIFYFIDVIGGAMPSWQFHAVSVGLKPCAIRPQWTSASVVRISRVFVGRPCRRFQSGGGRSNAGPCGDPQSVYNRRVYDDDDGRYGVVINRELSTLPQGSSPKTFWHPQHRSSTGGVKSFCTYTDRVNAILSYKRLLYSSLNCYSGVY